MRRLPWAQALHIPVVLLPEIHTPRLVNRFLGGLPGVSQVNGVARSLISVGANFTGFPRISQKFWHKFLNVRELWKISEFCGFS